MSLLPAPESQPYGSSIRHLWGLSDNDLIVNHGAYGATPIEVLQAQGKFRAMMEAHPTYFMQRALPDALRQSAAILADFVGGKAERLVFVENTTAGVNAVLRSLTLNGDDEILILSHTYAAVKKTVDYIAARSGARTVEVAVPFPFPQRDVLLSGLDAAIGPRTKLAILDHVTSPSALILPIAEMIAACRNKDIPVIVDGAHAPGQLPLHVDRLGADWYVGNCHKWLMAPKGAAFICASPESADIHPTTISHGFGEGLTAEFDWVGTRDWTACLSVPAAIAFHDRLGGQVLMARSRDLALRAAAYLADRFETDVAADGEWHGAMSLVRIPTVGDVSLETVLRLRSRLLDRQCDASVTLIGGAIWLRLSAAPYNDIEDFERLAELILTSIKV